MRGSEANTAADRRIIGREGRDLKAAMAGAVCENDPVDDPGDARRYDTRGQLIRET